MTSEVQIADALEKLARGRGVLRPDLVRALHGELSALRECWSLVIPEDSAAALRLMQRSVAGNLLTLIDQLEPRKAKQRGLSPSERLNQYRDGIRAYFNIPFPPNRPEYLLLREMDLTRRRAWLANEAPEAIRISVSAGQDDQVHAIKQMAAKIASTSYVPLSESQIKVGGIDSTAIEEELTSPRQSLAAVLSNGEVVLRTATRVAQQGDLVYREGPMRKVFEVLVASAEDGVEPICIWGEPGTGKTTLAHHFFIILYEPKPSMPPVALLRAGNPWQLRDDIVSLLVYEGMQPSHWSDSYAQAMLRQRFSNHPPRVRGVIIDGVEDEEVIAHLIPDRPRIPFIITMRKRPSASGLSSVRLEGFSEDESLYFVSSRLDDVSERDARRLANLFAGRPLALDHAVRFIGESPDIAIADVIDTVGKSMAGGLDLLADSVESSQNIAELYKMILSAVVENGNTRQVLEAFLAITGISGTVSRELLFYFLNSKEGGEINRPYFRSALRALDRVGLIHESRSMGAGVEADGTLNMHSLTFVILRELCGISSILSVQGRYCMYLSNLRADDSASSDSGGENKIYGKILARTLAEAMQLSRNAALPNGMRSLLCIDRNTWLAVMETTEAADTGTPHVIRYESNPTSIYKIDSRKGVREDLTQDEAYMLLDVVQQYATAVSARWPQPE